MSNPAMTPEGVQSWWQTFIADKPSLSKQHAARPFSQKQIDVFHWAVIEKGDLILLARAGCGKTFTLLSLCEILNDGRSYVSVMAFNKAIAVEIKGKLEAAGIPSRFIKAGTVHSFGLMAWRRVAPNVKIDNEGKKVPAIIDQMAMVTPTLAPYASFIRKAVSFAKQAAFGFLSPIQDKTKWFDLVDHFNLEEALPEDDNYTLDTLIDVCMKVLIESIKQDFTIVDYDDMILAPLTHNVRMFQVDWVLVDEAQDTNGARRALALKMLKPNTGRLIAVGDDWQAINGFAGADNDSLDQIRDSRKAKVLPLNVTYRCAKLIVAEAQQFVSDIIAADDNKEGIVRTIPQFGHEATDNRPQVMGLMDETLLPTDGILCRNTKPLIEVAYSLIRNGVACKVEGREIGQGLIALAKRWKLRASKTNPELVVLQGKLADYLDRERQKLQAKGKEAAIQALEDKVETLQVICQKLLGENKDQLQDLVDFIDNLFGDTKPENGGEVKKVLTLSTVHKAKGREWERVFILGYNKYMPSTYAKMDWEVEQERHLQYVAITRAINELVYVTV
jgi:superfamily I DNA/RNA helicase